jgi:trk system potassium uptake protein TrkA
MNIIIVGQDQKSQITGKSLYAMSHRVTFISNDEQSSLRMADLLEQPVICGDATKPEILESADIYHCDLLVAMTQKDADNLLICELAKRKYGVQRTLATVENRNNCIVFQRLGVDYVLCPADACSQLVVGTICPDFRIDMNHFAQCAAKA